MVSAPSPMLVARNTSEKSRVATRERQSGPSMVVFDTKQLSQASANRTPSLTSWEDGPVKQRSFVKRGRPAKGGKDARSLKADGQSQESEGLQKPVSRDFVFIDTSRSSEPQTPRVRKTIRSHAMLDYRRQEREQRRLSHRRPCEGGSPTKRIGTTSLDELQEKAMMRRPLIPRGIVAVDPFDSFPIKMEPYICELLSQYTSLISKKMYSIEQYTSFNPTTEYWLPLAFHDTALLHAILACADVYETAASGIRERPTAVTHLKESVRVVTERVQAGSPNLSDATLVVVATLSIMEKVCGNHDNWAVHMSGLKQMVRMRGGLASFESNRLVYLKICRADLCGSVDGVQKPYFRDTNALLPSLGMPPVYFSEGFQEIEAIVGFDPELRCIISKVEEVTSALNLLHLSNTHTDPLSLREAITSIQYSLLSTEPVERKLSESDAQEVCRLGVLLYLVTIMNELPQASPICDMLIRRLRRLLEYATTNSDLTIEFRLWLMFLASLVVVHPEIKAWCRASFVDRISELGISCREDTKRVLMSFFWVEKIHGENLIDLWNELTMFRGMT